MKPLNENAIEKHLLIPAEASIGATAVHFEGEILAKSPRWISQAGSLKIPIVYETRNVGDLLLAAEARDSREAKDLASQIGCLLQTQLPLQLKTLEWLAYLYGKLEARRDWVGVYWIESFLTRQENKIGTNDLIVGPYLGPVTPHVRISQDQGLCGLAVREARTINVADVRADSRFLACSISTRSEIVIPIQLESGRIVGELDIDSNTPNSFSGADQKWLENEAAQFARTLMDH